MFFRNWSKSTFLSKNKNKHNAKSLGLILMQFSIFISILHSIRLRLSKTRKKSRKIVIPKLVTTVSFQKGLNHQIGECKEIHKNRYKISRGKLTWILGLYISLTTILFESIKCNMVILKNVYFLRTMKSGLMPFWKETLQLFCYIKE